MLRDEDDVRLRQLAHRRALSQHAAVEHAAVVPRPPRDRPLARALHLAVIELPRRIHCKNVEPDAAPVEVLHTLLRRDALHLDIISRKDEPQDEVHTGNVPIETSGEKGIVDETKLLQDSQVFLRKVFRQLCHEQHLHSCLYSTKKSSSAQAKGGARLVGFPLSPLLP